MDIDPSKSIFSPVFSSLACNVIAALDNPSEEKAVFAMKKVNAFKMSWMLNVCFFTVPVQTETEQRFIIDIWKA